MVSVALQKFTVTCNVSGDNWLPRWAAISNTWRSSTHTLTHRTHNSWWPVLGRVTTKDDHPLLWLDATNHQKQLSVNKYIWMKLLQPNPNACLQVASHDMLHQIHLFMTFTHYYKITFIFYIYNTKQRQGLNQVTVHLQILLYDIDNSLRNSTLALSDNISGCIACSRRSSSPSI